VLSWATIKLLTSSYGGLWLVTTILNDAVVHQISHCGIEVNTIMSSIVYDEECALLMLVVSLTCLGTS
jgi:hypothetical protein